MFTFGFLCGFSLGLVVTVFVARRAADGEHFKFDFLDDLIYGPFVELPKDQLPVDSDEDPQDDLKEYDLESEMEKLKKIVDEKGGVFTRLSGAETNINLLQQNDNGLATRIRKLESRLESQDTTIKKLTAESGRYGSLIRNIDQRLQHGKVEKVQTFKNE